MINITTVLNNFKSNPVYHFEMTIHTTESHFSLKYVINDVLGPSIWDYIFENIIKNGLLVDP